MSDLPVEIQDWLIAEAWNGAMILYMIGVPLSFLGYLWLAYSSMKPSEVHWGTLLALGIEGIQICPFWPLCGLWLLAVWLWECIDAQAQMNSHSIGARVFNLIKASFSLVFKLWVFAILGPFVLVGSLIITLFMLLGEKGGRCENSGAHMYQPMTWIKFIRFKITGQGRQYATCGDIED